MRYGRPFRVGAYADVVLIKAVEESYPSANRLSHLTCPDWELFTVILHWSMQHVAVGRCSEMFGQWHSGMMLLFESSNVIGLRLTKIAHGGGDAFYETQLMIVEKLAAAFEAGTSVMTGATAVQVTERYRGYVAANAQRLGPGDSR